MSPEQCRGAHASISAPTSTRSACILYQMLTGRLPFEAEGLGELLLAHMTQQPPPLTELVPGHAAAPVAGGGGAMEKTPEARFQQVAEMMAAIGDPSGQYATLAGDGQAPGTSWKCRR